MDKIFFTGIGSRSCSDLDKLRDISAVLCSKGFILRSGGADGADTAFEQGCDSVNGRKEIYLPWKGFNGNKSPLFDIPVDAFKVARHFHPAWYKLSQGAKRLHASNIMQILGQDLCTPTNIVFCWTPEGKLIGGTRTGIEIAYEYNIEVINYGRK